MNPSESNRNIEYLNDFVEPGFDLGTNKDSKLPDDTDPIHAFNRFEYRLKQTPNDLSCHLQRLQFCISSKNRDALFASICDLFIILGEQGIALRQRLFNTYSKVFTREQLALLSAHLAEDCLSENNESLPDDCFFKKKTAELLAQAAPSINETQGGENILHVAESYIEKRQFDTAIEYMQEHLVQSPKNKALTLRLISLYKTLNCADKFHSAYKKFSNNVATSLYWNGAKQHFLNQ